MMKFATAKEHRDHFRKHRHVGFKGLLTEQQCTQLNDDINAVLCQRLGLRNPSSLIDLATNKLFLNGHDLWRADSKIKKILLNKNLAQTAADLLEHKPLRIGYDQLLPGFVSTKYGQPASDAYVEFLKSQASLPEVSCIQGVAGGLILCIESPFSFPEQEEESHYIASVFPKFAGYGVFVASDMMIDFNALKTLPEARYLLIVYSQFSSVYCHQERDPHLHSFRDLGYNFGDRLSERLHPLVYS